MVVDIDLVDDAGTLLEGRMYLMSFIQQDGADFSFLRWALRVGLDVGGSWGFVNAFLELSEWIEGVSVGLRLGDGRISHCWWQGKRNLCLRAIDGGLQLIGVMML